MRQPSLAALMAFLPAAVLSSLQAPQRFASFDAGYPDSRTIDRTNEYANVGALITMAESNDAGVPEGNLAWCTGTLIRDRVMLTAGHCVCAGLPAPPPFVRIFASFASDARNQTTWLPVARIVGHPSLPPAGLFERVERATDPQPARRRSGVSRRAGSRHQAGTARETELAGSAEYRARVDVHRGLRLASADSGSAAMG